jgi:hypothetical protein
MRSLVALAAVLVTVATASDALAAPPSSAGCAGIITRFEATEFPPGSVGAETSGLAGPEFGHVVSGLATIHLGNLEECAAEAP